MVSDRCPLGYLFSLLKVVVLNVKLSGMKQRTQCQHIFCPFMHTGPQKRSKGQLFFLKEVMLHIKLQKKSVEHYASLTLSTPPKLLGWVKMSPYDPKLLVGCQNTNKQINKIVI